MRFEQVTNQSIVPQNWTSCANCGGTVKHADYHTRSSETASQLNAANNGKSCVSS